VGFTSAVYNSSLIGNDFRLSNIRCIKGNITFTNTIGTNVMSYTVAAPVTNIIRQNVTFLSTTAGAWNFTVNNVLEFCGVVGATNPNFRIPQTDGVTTRRFSGNTNTYGGGLYWNNTQLGFASDGSLGAVPAAPITELPSVGIGYGEAVSQTGKFNKVSMHKNRGMQCAGQGMTLIAQPM